MFQVIDSFIPSLVDLWFKIEWVECVRLAFFYIRYITVSRHRPRFLIHS